MKHYSIVYADFDSNDYAMTITESVLNMVLAGKVRSGNTSGKALRPHEKRRIETYSPIKSGHDWQMRQELFSETALWLSENRDCFDGFLIDGKLMINFYKEEFFTNLCNHFDKFMGLHWKESGIVEKKRMVNGVRTSVYECRKLALTKYDSESGNELSLELDSKAWKDFIISDFIKSEINGYDQFDVLIHNLRMVVKDDRKFDCFVAHVINGVDVTTIRKSYNKENDCNIRSDVTIYRWIKAVSDTCVNWILEEKKRRAKEEYSCNYCTNVKEQAENATFGKCELKGDNIVAGKEIDVLLDGNVYDYTWKINTAENECVDTFLSVEKVGIDWMCWIEKSDFASVGYNVKAKKSKAVKYIPKKSAHGQGNDYYHVGLNHVRESNVIPLDKWIDSLSDTDILSIRDKVRKVAKNSKVVKNR